jgi:hypothetical protein
MGRPRTTVGVQKCKDIKGRMPFAFPPYRPGIGRPSGLTLHDEIVVETRDELAETVVGIIAECLKEASMGIVPEMPFELIMRIAEAWGDYSDCQKFFPLIPSPPNGGRGLG